MLKSVEISQKLQDKYDRLLLPDYQKSCIVNIPDYIKYLHGLKNESVLRDNDERTPIKQTVLFTLDGFGYKQWQEHQSDHSILTKFADRGSVRAVTSMFPSSTAPSTSAPTGPAWDLLLLSSNSTSRLTANALCSLLLSFSLSSSSTPLMIISSPSFSSDSSSPPPPLTRSVEVRSEDGR